MSRETRSCKTHAFTLSQVELHPAIDAIDAPLGKNIKFSLRICKVTIAGNRKKYFEIISVQKNAKWIETWKNVIYEQNKEQRTQMTTLGDAGSHRKSLRFRTTSFYKLLATGQIRPYRLSKQESCRQIPA
jgi:hypothetical protein